jgi:hypothetical protein
MAEKSVTKEKKGTANRKVSGSVCEKTLKGQTPWMAPGWKRPGKRQL